MDGSGKGERGASPRRSDPGFIVPPYGAASFGSAGWGLAGSWGPAARMAGFVYL